MTAHSSPLANKRKSHRPPETTAAKIDDFPIFLYSIGCHKALFSSRRFPMTIRQYLFVMGCATILCWIAFGMVVLNVDPFQASVSGFLFFYCSLFLSLLGTTSIAAFARHYFFSKNAEPLFRYVERGFRDGCICSAMLVALLYLQAQSFLNPWNGALLILFFIFIFAYRWSVKRTREFVP